MTIIKRGGSTSDIKIGLHGVPAFLSGQTVHRLGRLFFDILVSTVHGVARQGRPHGLGSSNGSAQIVSPRWAYGRVAYVRSKAEDNLTHASGENSLHVQGLGRMGLEGFEPPTKRL